MKFAHLAEKSEKGSISNLSTELRAAVRARAGANVPDRKFLSIHVRRAEIAQTGVELLLRHLQHAKTGIRIVQRTQHLGRAEAVCALVERFDIEPFSDFSAK